MHTARFLVTFVIVLLVVLGGCRSKEGNPSDARVMNKPVAEIALGNRKAELPRSDVAPPPSPAPTVTQDDAGKRLAYRTTTGQQARIVYVIGEGLFIGPLVSAPVDFRAAPDVDHALAVLFETAGTTARRMELAREVKREKGEAALVRLLVDAAYVDDPAWDDAKKTLLSPASESSLRDALAVGLEKGKSPILLRRAVAVIELHATASRAKVIAARARELADGKEEPRAVAVLLRATIANGAPEAASIGCEVLTKKPASGELVSDEANALIEAALLAIAIHGKPSPCDAAIEAMLSTKAACMPFLRCNESGKPLTWSESSKQDEPLCSKAQLADVMTHELLDRSPRDILEGTATRPELFAYAALLGQDRVPSTFTSGHARRRYAITQIGEPACDSGIVPGTACHCDEATLRSAACRDSKGAHVDYGFCSFDVDANQKKIQNVVAGKGTP